MNDIRNFFQQLLEQGFIVVEKNGDCDAMIVVENLEIYSEILVDVEA